MRQVVTKGFILLLFAALQLETIYAQDDKGIRVERIVPALSNGRLTVSAEFRNLFSKRIVGTIQSGLPSIIQIEIKLNDNANHSLVRRRISQTLKYELWEERYTLKNRDTTRVYKNFEDVKADCNRLLRLALLAFQALVPDQRYHILLRVGIVPISARQAEKVTDWLQASNQTDENMASDERTSSFQVNLNKLVSFFISNRKRSVFASRWFSSHKFTIDDLQE